MLSQKLREMSQSISALINKYPQIRDRSDLCSHYRQINSLFGPIFAGITSVILAGALITVVLSIFSAEERQTLPHLYIVWVYSNIVFVSVTCYGMRIRTAAQEPSHKKDFDWQRKAHTRLQLAVLLPTVVFMFFPTLIPVIGNSGEVAGLGWVVGIMLHMHICTWVVDGAAYKIFVICLYNSVYCAICIYKGYFTTHKVSRLLSPLILASAFILVFDKYVKENFLLKRMLKQQKTMYEQHLDKVQDPVVILDKSQLLFLNEASKKCIGTSLEEFYQKADSITSKKGTSLTQQIQLQLFNDSHSRDEPHHDTYHTLIMGPKSKPYQRTLNVTLIESFNLSGKKIVSLTLHDATDQLMREQARVEEKYKNMLLFSLSHELRTPLNIFQAFLSVSKPLMTTSPSAMEMLKNAKGAWCYLRNKISDILDYAQISAEEFTLHKVKFSIRRFVHHLHKTAQCLLGARSSEIRLKFLVREDVNDDLVGDRDRLEQVLFNFVSNALNYTEAGQISLEVFPDRHDRRKICFQVTDTGCGISREFIKSLFEIRTHRPSSKALDRSRRHKSEGLCGLGLTISKLICNRMGSDIRVTSEPGKGSTFAFSLVAQQLQSPERSGELSPSDYLQLIEEDVSVNTCRSQYTTGSGTKSCHKVVVLVVDDNPLNRFVAKGMAKKLGALTEEANNGKVAIEKLISLQSKIHDAVFIVLMDIEMPVMDGIEATAEIRRMKMNPQPHIIALTAFASEAEREKCIKVGMDDFITKPLTKQSLVDILYNLHIAY